MDFALGLSTYCVDRVLFNKNVLNVHKCTDKLLD